MNITKTPIAAGSMRRLVGTTVTKAIVISIALLTISASPALATRDSVSVSGETQRDQQCSPADLYDCLDAAEQDLGLALEACELISDPDLKDACIVGVNGVYLAAASACIEDYCGTLPVHQF